MLLKVTHSTTLTYDAPVCETIMELRMAPRQQDQQHRLSFNLAIGPGAPVSSYFDWLGNLVHVFSITPFHEELHIDAESVVQTHADKHPLETLRDTWPLNGALPYSMQDYLGFSSLVDDSEPLRAMVAAVRARNGMALSDLALRIVHEVYERFTYETGITTSSTRVSEVLEHHKGVCQDFTHVTIGVARTLGIPARYVSGVVHAPGNEYRGAAQTHAWCELYFPSVGWVGFDTTNNCRVEEHFVRVAVGRDYRDVPPNRGLYKGQAKEAMAVSVLTEELSAVPGRLAGERITSLPVRTFEDEHRLDEEETLAEQQQQQQQQQ